MSLSKDRATHAPSDKKPRRRNWSAIDVAGYRIDVIHPRRQGLVGWSPSLLKVVSFSIGYALVLAAVTRGMAHYLGWSPTLLLFGAAHLGFALVAVPRDAEITDDSVVEPAPMGMPGWHLMHAHGEEGPVSQTGERPGLSAARPPVVRPPAFPPRTRTFT
ncbi:MAG TPA: hypothetical protein VHU40_10950 [Polyangia bacterium]|nr:hypothetical protein [Polyangia bacterium]